MYYRSPTRVNSILAETVEAIPVATSVARYTT